MSRVWVIFAAALIVANGGVVLVHGLTAGAWMRGLMFGVALPAFALTDWLKARAEGEAARDAADRLVLSIIMALTALAWT